MGSWAVHIFTINKPFLFNLVPVRDDGNMPDVPAHPSDKEGPNLEWLKKL